MSPDPNPSAAERAGNIRAVRAYHGVMRTLLVLLAAAVVVGIAGWFLLRPSDLPPGPADSPSGETPAAPATDSAHHPANGPAPAPAPAPAPVPVPAGPLRVPFVPEPMGDHSASPGAIVPPLPEGEIEILRTGRTRDDQAKVDATRAKIIETRMGEIDWRKVTLRDAADRIAAKTGVPVEFEGSGLDTETVTYKETVEAPALEVLRTVAGRATLRFEILADRVVVKR